MMSRDLHVNEVTISTASVDVQVMRIGAKQMTLAVFRQLQRRDIFDGSGELLTVPWGWVNYDWESSSKPFVFSHEDVLYRSGVDIAQHGYLGIEPEMLERTGPRISTGKWLIRVPENQWYKPDQYGDWITSSRWYDHRRISLRFDSESDARVHLENRLRNLPILEAAPQLFIGV